MYYYFVDFNPLPNISNFTAEYIKKEINHQALLLNKALHDDVYILWTPISSGKYLLVNNFCLEDWHSEKISYIVKDYCFHSISKKIYELLQKNACFTLFELLKISQNGLVDNGFSRDVSLVIDVNDLCTIRSK